MAGNNWYAVRCVFEAFEIGDCHTYEERITLWHAESSEEAIDQAEAEALAYAGNDGIAYLGLAQAYVLDGSPSQGAEVFSLMRDSDLEPDTYLTDFFDTGRERQGQYGH